MEGIGLNLTQVSARRNNAQLGKEVESGDRKDGGMLIFHPEE